MSRGQYSRRAGLGHGEEAVQEPSQGERLVRGLGGALTELVKALRLIFPREWDERDQLVDVKAAHRFEDTSQERGILRGAGIKQHIPQLRRVVRGRSDHAPS